MIDPIGGVGTGASVISLLWQALDAVKTARANLATSYWQASCVRRCSPTGSGCRAPSTPPR